jgi:hypothetical protein
MLEDRARPIKRELDPRKPNADPRWRFVETLQVARKRRLAGRCSAGRE